MKSSRQLKSSYLYRGRRPSVVRLFSLSASCADWWGRWVTFLPMEYSTTLCLGWAGYVRKKNVQQRGMAWGGVPIWLREGDGCIVFVVAHSLRPPSVYQHGVKPSTAACASKHSFTRGFRFSSNSLSLVSQSTRRPSSCFFCCLVATLPFLYTRNEAS